jgi:glycosyltransferase involved in cell wall biosynthesis
LKIRGVEYQYVGKQSIKSYWRSYGVIKNVVKDKIDLFHGLSNEIPYGLKKAGIPTVVTIHDLIFIRYPEYYPLLDRLIYRFKFRHAALKADKIIAISNQTKQDLIRFFGIKEDRIDIIYQNCDPVFHKMIIQEARNAIAQKYNLPEKYLLNVGTIEKRKNLMLIVKALREVDHIPLVVVGRETDYAGTVKEYIRQNKLTDRIIFLKNVTYTDLPGIYQQAEMFIYPSRFEGFGIPIIEAMHSGIPVIAAKGSCLEEAGGPDSIYVDPDDEKDLAKQIKNILENGEKKADMISSGREYLGKFEDKKIADQVIQLYQNIIDNA